MVRNGEMLYLSRRPAPPLDAFVSDLWLYSGYQPPHTFERILPSGTVELVVGLTDRGLSCYDPATLTPREPLHGAVVSGVRAGLLVVDTEQQREIVGAHFRPGGAFTVLGLPVDELAELDLPLEALWGAAARTLHERLLASRTPADRLDVLERALAARVRPEARLHPVVRRALETLGRADEAVTIGAIAAEVGWSDRHFIRTFKAQVGVAPKLYGRIRRFQAALRRVQTGQVASWSALALDCGYYDQAHFNRDFRAFAGMTPTEFARLRPSAIAHLPLNDGTLAAPVVKVGGSSSGR